jgi:peroxiredoxin
MISGQCVQLMTNSAMKTIKQWRKNKYNAWLMDACVVAILLLAFSWYQTRGTLKADGQPAPDFTLQDLQGQTHQLRAYQGKQVLLYFFAPWCTVCRFSADNLNDLRAARGDDWVILSMAVSYDEVSEVEAFVAELDLQVPVLLGGNQQMDDYQLQAFPTYYVLDEQGQLMRRSVGYSTELGMRVRTF